MYQTQKNELYEVIVVHWHKHKHKNYVRSEQEELSGFKMDDLQITIWGLRSIKGEPRSMSVKLLSQFYWKHITLGPLV